ncbi:MAG: 3-oxo-5-alpha-steroid 4-dehydrogenase, partial [Prevotellaceae bacterium]|nr:3-oxo-5-alpha-steroid 4-dehydrogenase [Prevotellaceae bacterium]
AIVAMGVVFNVLNGMMQAGGLFYFPRMGLYDAGAACLLRPHALLGLLLFFIGMGVNLHSDYVIRHLRKPGDTAHYLPAKGLYRYVTSANYFGELVEWTGFAVLTLSPAAWVFVWWTFANLVPRADAIHRRYREEFGDEAVGRRKRVIPFIY